MSDRVTAWYEAYSVELLGYIRKLTEGHPDAEDICAMVWTEAILKADQLDDTPRAWLYQAARWRVIDWQRVQHLRPSASFDQEIDAAYTGVEDRVLDWLAGRAVWETTRLTRMQRLTFWQVYAEGRSIREVGVCLGLSPNAVKALLHRAKVHLLQNPILNSAPI